MKKTFTYLLMLGVFMLPNIIVSADENYYLENNNGIKITEEEYQKLIAIDFTDNEIMNMSQNDFDILTNYDNGNVEKNTKYIKEVNVYYDNLKQDTFVYEFNRLDREVVPVETYFYEITEEEYENASLEDFLVSPNSLVNDGRTYETTYKKIALVISYRTESSTTKNISAKLTWKTMPSVRSFDVIAIRVTNGLFTKDTQSGTVNYSYRTPVAACDGNYVTMNDAVSYSNSNSAWNKATTGLGYSGIGLTVGLPVDAIRCFNDLSVPFYENLTAHSTYIVSTATTSNQITAYATYQHATSYVAFGNVYNSYGFSSNGLGGVISFNNGMGSNYDGMGGVSLTY